MTPQKYVHTLSKFFGCFLQSLKSSKVIFLRWWRIGISSFTLLSQRPRTTLNSDISLPRNLLHIWISTLMTVLFLVSSFRHFLFMGLGREDGIFENNHERKPTLVGLRSRIPRTLYVRPLRWGVGRDSCLILRLPVSRLPSDFRFLLVVRWNK